MSLKRFDIDPLPLALTANLIGAGVYAIYYTGDFLAYEAIAKKNRDDAFDQPIYVGKAIPKGGRKGCLSEAPALGTPLRDRLRQHTNSINQADNLRLEDFQYRALMVDDVWIPLGESMVIERFRPIWNLVIDGFGNNAPGKGRHGQVKPSWDTLHPGRKVMTHLPDNPMGPAILAAKIDAFFKGQLPAEELIQTDDENGQDS